MRLLNLILALVLVLCAVMVAGSFRDGHRSRRESEDARILAASEPEPAPQTGTRRTLPRDPMVLQLLQTDLASLRGENEDVLGWITIPDTEISYPLLRGTDNEFYLEHTWKKTPNSSGAIFLECRNRPDFTDFNTIIYGHNMKNGSMFASLRDYKREGYLEQHPSFYIVSDQGVLRYDIFAVHKVSTQDIVYGLELDTRQRRSDFLQFAGDNSQLNTGIVPTEKDHIVTLSTCSGQGHDTRWVVQGVLNEEDSYRFTPAGSDHIFGSPLSLPATKNHGRRWPCRGFFIVIQVPSLVLVGIIRDEFCHQSFQCSGNNADTDHHRGADLAVTEHYGGSMKFV